VFYKFTLSTPMKVTVYHCGSSLNDTYMHIIDGSNGRRIADCDDNQYCSNNLHAYIQINLSAGTYYIVSEGYDSNGVIVTSVTGELPAVAVSYNYDASGNRLQRSPSVTLLSASSITVRNKDVGPDDPGSNVGGDKGDVGKSPDGSEANDAPYIGSITVYPNPTEGLLTVFIPDYHDGSDASLCVYDMTGKKKYSCAVSGAKETVDMSSYTAGVYVVEITISGKTSTHKIIKH
jgi:hypothetical protein